MHGWNGHSGDAVYAVATGWWMRVAVALAVIVGAALPSAGTAGAATIPPGSDYVAIGSSIAAGPYLPPLVDVACGRSGINYPHLVAQSLSLQLRDVTCSAATTGNVLSTPQGLAGGSSNPVQIDAVGPSTRLVTVSIGGNDVQYIGRLTANSCANTPLTVLPGICNAIAAQPRTTPTAADFSSVENRLVRVVTAARARAPQARIVLVDYPPILDPANRGCALVPLTAAQFDTHLRIADSLAAATRRAADRTGATLVRASASGVGHTPCSSDPWMTGFQAPGPLGGPLPYHATASGMAAVAAQIVRTLG